MSLIHVVVNYIYSTGILNGVVNVVNVIIVLCNVSVYMSFNDIY